MKRKLPPLYVSLDQDQSRFRLTSSEELELIREAQGDPGGRAEARLVQFNQGLCHSIARKYASRLLSYEDAFQWAGIGLLTAIRRFDLATGHKLSTYAVMWMRQCCSRAIDNEGRQIRIPAHIKEKQGKLERLRRTLTSQLRREPTEEELFEASGLTEREWDTLQAVPDDPLELDCPMPSKQTAGADGDTLLDITDGWHANDLCKPEDWPEQEDHRTTAETFCKRLRGLSRGHLVERIIRMRYGLEPYGHAHTLQEIADALVADGTRKTCSRENVRQYEKRGMEACRLMALGHHEEK